ncbi:lipocalin family protein [Flavobacterium sp.]|uniref:lipocalin family protein n=1 Tax=Flavobacterium sp. TaxID=239 RepID=UPI0025F9DDB5|nr:lipocalin family protein [Flavobacterium sp.]
MKKISIFFFALLLISCHSNVQQEDIAKLNGYWEIKQVKFSTGKTKDYKVNETIDYFELKDNHGFRQKVMPQFDGKFQTNGIKENIKLVENDNTFFIEYNAKFGKWKEEIISIEDSTLVLKNKDNLEYTYKKFKPFSFK